MQQPQFYKTVRASEYLPEESGKYFVIHPGLGEIIASISHPDQAGLTLNNCEWLEPIPIPDAEVLRMALSDISEMIDTNRQPSLNQIRAIARESLSNTSDGWIRVEDGNLPTEEGDYLCGYEYDLPGEKLFKQFVSKFGFYRLRQTGELNPDSDGITGCFTDHGNRAKLVTHWRPLPSPPQPINP